MGNQIMNIGGEELKTAKAKVDEATKKCEDMRKLIKKSLLDADLMDKNSKKAEASAQTAKEEYCNVKSMQSLTTRLRLSLTHTTSSRNLWLSKTRFSQNSGRKGMMSSTQPVLTRIRKLTSFMRWKKRLALY